MKELKMDKVYKVRDVRAYYGPLVVGVSGGKYYWGVDNYNGVYFEPISFEPISYELFCALEDHGLEEWEDAEWYLKEDQE